MLKKLLSGICAGILITIGGSVFLACENRYVGAVMFSVALLCICLKGYSLYTGRIGFIVESHDKEYFSGLFLGLLGNAIGTLGGGLAIRYALPKLGEAAEKLVAAKLEQSFPSALIRACFCGILMYLAVSIFKEKNGNVIGIIFCIPVFILSGFEHSIADMFYFAAGTTTWVGVKMGVGYILTIILGNSIGAVILPLLSLTRKKAEKKDE